MWFLLAAASIWGVVSGFNDGGSMLASATSGRVISPRAAMATLLLTPLGPLLVGTQVARTVGVSVVDLSRLGAMSVGLITTAAVAVVLYSWRARVPTSMTLALVGAMVGWALADRHAIAIHWHGLARVIAGVPLSVLAGGVLALCAYRVVRRGLSALPHATALKIAKCQHLAAAIQAIAYGSNDMEKTIGLAAFAESTARRGQPHFGGGTPLAVASASFIAGTALGGWAVARRVSAGLFRVRPVQAMTEQFVAGFVVTGLAFVGAPVSSTQTVGGSLIGVGVGARASAVRWTFVREMLISWFVTLPLALIVALIAHLLLRASSHL